MRWPTTALDPAPARCPRLRLAFVCAGLLATVCAACTAPLESREELRMLLGYGFEDTQPNAAQQERMRAFLADAAREGRRHFLVQGFACDTGGYSTSLNFARLRASRTAESLARLLPRAQGNDQTAPIRAEGVVLSANQGERFFHRYAVIRAFASEAALLEAKRVADLRAAEQNAATLAGEASELNWTNAAAVAEAMRADGRLIPAEARDLLAQDPADDAQQVGAGEHETGVRTDSDAGSQDRSNDDASPDQAAGRDWFLFGFLLVLIVFLGLAVYVFRRLLHPGQERRKRDRHRLSREEAGALEFLTGGEVQPVAVADDAAGATADRSSDKPQVDPDDDATDRESESRARPRRGVEPRRPVRPASAAGAANSANVREFLKLAGSPLASGAAPGGARSTHTMAAKKKKTAASKQQKITPISIRGAVEKGYEAHSLSELAKAPVDALDGLTARHARLLEEAFGVKSVEDLAALKYVEIARAIVILSRYES